MIEFIRPPLGPRVDLLRVRALERIQPLPAEDPTRIIVQTEQAQTGYPSYFSSRRTTDTVEISDEARRRLAAEEKLLA
jgi:hypothetical protein